MVLEIELILNTREFVRIHQKSPNVAFSEGIMHNYTGRHGWRLVTNTIDTAKIFAFITVFGNAWAFLPINSSIGLIQKAKQPVNPFLI
mmetsp:Transcript_26530/g.54740  ORF Transcript_26530/g.54740 Transcript_26530/m.54740 type:complete len:88 (-) Transcript_26530:1295-1558(-)